MTLSDSETFHTADESIRSATCKPEIKKRKLRKADTSEFISDVKESKLFTRNTLHDEGKHLFASAIKKRSSFLPSLANKIGRKTGFEKGEKPAKDKKLSEIKKNKQLSLYKASFDWDSLTMHPSLLSNDSSVEGDKRNIIQQWNECCDPEILVNMSKSEIKLQNLIHEFYTTEASTVNTLRIMEIYSHSFINNLGMSSEIVERIFPMLPNLIDFHSQFCHALNLLRPSINYIVTSVGPTIYNFFTGAHREELINIYSTFCYQSEESVSFIKETSRQSKRFSDYLQKCQQIHTSKCQSIPDLHLSISQRITKYPTMVSELIKHTKIDSPERTRLEEAQTNIKSVLETINTNITKSQNNRRKAQILTSFDKKSVIYYNNSEFSYETMKQMTFLYDTKLQLKISTTKSIDAILIIMDNLVIFLQSGPHNKYSFPSVDKCPIIPLVGILVKKHAAYNHNLFIISKNSPNPEIYELICQHRFEADTLVKKLIDFAAEAKPYFPPRITDDAKSDAAAIRSIRIKEFIDNSSRIDQQLYDLLDERRSLYNDVNTFLYDQPEQINLSRNPLENYLYSSIHYAREASLGALKHDDSASTRSLLNEGTESLDSFIPFCHDDPNEVLNRLNKLNIADKVEEMSKQTDKAVFPLLRELLSVNDCVLKSAIGVDSSFKSAKIHLDEVNRSLSSQMVSQQRNLNELDSIEKESLKKDEVLVKREQELSLREGNVRDHISVINAIIDYGGFDLRNVPKNIADAFEEMRESYGSKDDGSKVVTSVREKQSIPVHLISATNQRRLMLSEEKTSSIQQTGRLLQLSSKSKLLKNVESVSGGKPQVRTSDLGDDYKNVVDTLSEKELYF